MPIPPPGAFAPAPGVAPAPPARPSFASALERRAAAFRTPTATSTSLATSASSPTPTRTPTAHPAVAALAGLERAQARLDGVLAAARTGRTFTAAELLGLQAEAYRCSQTVDLAAKLVEQGAQAVRQALNTPL